MTTEVYFVEQDFTVEFPVGSPGSTYTAGTGISIASGVITNTAPNTVQTLSIAGQNLSLSGGGGTVVIPSATNNALGTGFTAGGGSGIIPSGTTATVTEGGVNAYNSFFGSNLTPVGGFSFAGLGATDGTSTASFGFTDDGGLIFGSEITDGTNNYYQTFAPLGWTSDAGGNRIIHTTDGLQMVATVGNSVFSYQFDQSAYILTNDRSIPDVGTVRQMVPVVGITAGTGIGVSTASGVVTVTNSAPNVVQTLSIVGQDLSLSGGGGTVAIPGTVYTAGTGISVAGNVITNTSPNVTQTLSIVGQELTLSSGGGTVTIPSGGGSISEPSTQILVGTGAGVDSYTGLTYDPTNKTLLFVPDITLDQQTFIKVGEGRSSPYTYAPFGLGVEYASPGQTPYLDYVWTFGPNALGNSGVAFDVTKPMASINWETSWIDGGVPTFEWHEHWKNAGETAIRLKSYTIRYANALAPSTAANIDLYHSADQFSVKSGEAGSAAYFSISRNRTSALAALTLQTYADGAITLGGSKTGSQNIFYFQPSGITGTSQFNLGNWDELSFSGSGDGYVKSTRRLNSDVLVGFSSIITPLLYLTSTGKIQFGGVDGFGIGSGQVNLYAGYGAGPAGYVGDFNVGINYRALLNITGAAQRNIAVGSGAGQNIGAAFGNVLLGHYAANASSGALTGSVVIGDFAAATMTGTDISNKLWIANSNTTTPLLSGDFTTGQIGINTANAAPAASAVLDIVSTTKGLLPPRMTVAQRDAISSTATGLTLYCTDATATDASTGVMQTYNGTTWKNHW